MEKINIDTVIKDFIKEKIYFHPNPGNAGDSLINVGCYDFFQHNDIEYTEFWSDHSELNSPQDKIVVLGGGGGFVPAWNFTRNFVKKYHKTAKKLILMPQTIYGNEDLLSELGENVVIFVREKKSYEHVLKNINKNVNLFLTDDMAFYVNLDNINNTVNAKKTSKIKLKEVWSEAKGHLVYLLSQGRLSALRLDAESTNVKIPYNNFDVSIAFTYGASNEDINRHSAYKFLKYLSRYNSIETNRLHVAVGSALLGKKVIFRANNYFKCKAVYENSINNRFKNVIWSD